MVSKYANYVTLKEYCKHFGCCYKTAYNRFHAGKIAGAYKSAEDGHIYVPVENLEKNNPNDVTIYATATSNNSVDTLTMEEEVRLMRKYCYARGWRIKNVVKEICNEIATGFRPKFNELLRDKSVRKILINKKSDICFYGFEYIKSALLAQGRYIHAMDYSKEVSDVKTAMKEAVNTIYAMCQIIAGDIGISKIEVKRLITKLIVK